MSDGDGMVVGKFVCEDEGWVWRSVGEKGWKSGCVGTSPFDLMCCCIVVRACGVV